MSGMRGGIGCRLLSGPAIIEARSPHPSPLPMGEGSCMRSRAVEQASPLPGGEGQGEGRFAPFFAPPGSAALIPQRQKAALLDIAERAAVLGDMRPSRLRADCRNHLAGFKPPLCWRAAICGLKQIAGVFHGVGGLGADLRRVGAQHGEHLGIARQHRIVGRMPKRHHGLLAILQRPLAPRKP